MDAFLLRKTDAFVLWLWNNFGVPRMSIIRVFGIAWAISIVCSTVLLKGSVTFGSILSAIIVLTVMTIDFFTITTILTTWSLTPEDPPKRKKEEEVNAEVEFSPT